MARLRSTMREHNVEWVLTADPINITYATGVRNMNVFSMMGPTRLLLLGVEGPAILWEFAGSEHLAEHSPIVDEVRTTPDLTAIGGPSYRESVRAFSADIADAIGASTGATAPLAVERLDYEVTDSLRSLGCQLDSATSVFVESRRIKLPSELAMMDEAMVHVESAVRTMIDELHVGRTEIEVWSHFHRDFIASGGEYISTRLVQAGAKTFPYFQEAGENRIADGDLFCIDTDAIGFGGYGVDFSRTYHVGAAGPTSEQSLLYELAYEQLQHNVALVAPGVDYGDFASRAWAVPDRYRAFGYSSLAHGLGMCGEFPYVPSAQRAGAEVLSGSFEPNMVICVESYIGDPDLGQGVKLEDQLVVTESGARSMSTLPFGL